MVGPVAAYGRHVDDGALAAPGHTFAELDVADVRAAQVGAGDAVPAFDLEMLGWRLWREQRCTVGEPVDGAMARFNLGGRACNRSLVGHVHRHAVATVLGRGPLRGGGVDVGDHHLPAARPQDLAGGRADATGSARYHRQTAATFRCPVAQALFPFAGRCDERGYIAASNHAKRLRSPAPKPDSNACYQMLNHSITTANIQGRGGMRGLCREALAGVDKWVLGNAV